MLVHNWQSQICSPPHQLHPTWPLFPCHALQIDFCIHQQGLRKDPGRDNPWETFTLAHSSTLHSWPWHGVLSFSLPAVGVLCAINTTVMFHNNCHSITARQLWEVPLGEELRDMIDTYLLTRYQKCNTTDRFEGSRCCCINCISAGCKCVKADRPLFLCA